MSDVKSFPYEEHLTPELRLHLEQLHNKHPTLQEMWTVLGHSVEGDSATGEDPDGKENFNRLLGRIKRELCQDPRVLEFADGARAGDIIAIAMVCTAKLASVAFAGVDVCAIGILVARIGVREVCRSEKIE